MLQTCIVLLATSHLSTAIAPFYTSEVVNELHLRIPNEYTVKLIANHTLEDHFKYLGCNLSETLDTSALGDFEWISSFHGYFIRINETFLESRIQHDPGVEWVDQNRALEIHSLSFNSSVKAIDYDQPFRRASALSTEKEKLMKRASGEWNRVKENLPWNVRQLLTFGKDPGVATSDFADAYILDGAGLGVDVYVLDTGVRIEHELLNIHGAKARHYTRKFVQNNDGDNWNTHGHGTAMAGVIKMVAPYSNIIDVKVQGTKGDSYSIARAIYSVTQRHKALRDREPKLPNWSGSVINLSLTSDDVPILRSAVAEAIDAGIPIIATAGNFGADSCRYPGLYADVICVGAITRDYEMYQVSNREKGLTVWAGGKDIYSSTNGGNQAYGLFTGTSLAAPHVAGIIATFVGYEKIADDARLYAKRLQQNWNEQALGFDNKRLAQTGIGHPDKNNYPYFGLEKTDQNLQKPDKKETNPLHAEGPIDKVGDNDEYLDDSLHGPMLLECYPPSGFTLDNTTWIAFADQFCEANNGTTLAHQQNETLDGAIEGHYEKQGISARFYSFMDDRCYDPGMENEAYTLIGDDCTHAIQGLLGGCSGDDTEKPGGGVRFRCQYYNLLPQLQSTPL